MKIKWTEKSYNALYRWSNPATQVDAEKDLPSEVVAKLQNAPNLGVWYRLTREAAESVGEGIVARSAAQAEAELNELVK